jgi:catechol 2,3-dioxygenase-like lactoylglutathione lyase family enzyme
MKTKLAHVQLNVKEPSISFPFYKDLFKYFEYEIIVEDEECLGFSNGTTDFWINAVEEKYKANKFHRKNIGINHLCFKVDSKEKVDKFYNEFLKPRNISALYKTPKMFPEYTPDYYAVFFEDPDRIKLEVNHHGN